MTRRVALAAALLVGACGEDADHTPTTAEMAQTVADQCLSPEEDPSTVELVDSADLSLGDGSDADVTVFAFRYVTDRGDGTEIWTRAEYSVVRRPGEGVVGDAQCGAEAKVICDPTEIAELEIREHDHCEWYWQPVAGAGT